MKKGHLIKSVEPESIGEELGIEAGDVLLAIGEQEIEDIFDYQFLIQDTYIEVLIRKPSGEEWILEIDKEYDEDLGLEFDNGLMDDYRSCHNKCVFCFIDQMPKGMRETLYFKDDDSRLSFLQGNYVTLTNMSDHDVERICRYHLEPINISFQTTNPELRVKMLHNRFAGEALQKVKKFYEAGIRMNGQIVLCKGLNDGAELERSIRDLSEYLPYLESVSVVPVGLSKYREGLYPLEPFTKEDALAVVETIHKWQSRLYEKWGLHFIHASDEWYILADLPMPEEECYDGYLQLENGVGMLRLLMDEVKAALNCFEKQKGILAEGNGNSGKREISLATGRLAGPYMKEIIGEIQKSFPNVKLHLYEIRNDFFGEMITVSGLLTGQDLCQQLKGQKLGERLLLPQNVLRSGEEVFLDDWTLQQLSDSLQVPIDIVKSSGVDLTSAVTGLSSDFFMEK